MTLTFALYMYCSAYTVHFGQFLVVVMYTINAQRKEKSVCPVRKKYVYTVTF